MSAPLAAAAVTSMPIATGCSDMAMADHKIPASKHEEGKPCCIAVPPAIDPPQTVVGRSNDDGHLAFVVLTEPFRLGAGPMAEDPPPRRA